MALYSTNLVLSFLHVMAPESFTQTRLLLCVSASSSWQHMVIDKTESINLDSPSPQFKSDNSNETVLQYSITKKRRAKRVRTCTHLHSHPTPNNKKLYHIKTGTTQTNVMQRNKRSLDEREDGEMTRKYKRRGTDSQWGRDRGDRGDIILTHFTVYSSCFTHDCDDSVCRKNVYHSNRHKV